MTGRKSTQRAAVWLLALVLIFAQSGLPSMVLAQGPEPLELEQTIDQLERLFMALEAAAKEIPRDTFDPEAILDEVDLEAEALFYWVRDNTYLVPYRGALRGPVGVLMGRVGNSLDRALLLSELLQLLGYDTRLARGRLSLEQVQGILAEVRPIPLEGALPEAPADDALIFRLEQLVGTLGINQATLQQQMERLAQERQQLAAEVAQRVEEQADFIATAIGAPEGTAQTSITQLEALRDHWWVQYQEGGLWTDLDPTLQDAEPAQVAIEPTEILMLEELAELHSDLLHSFQVRVVLECWRDEGLVETILLESPALLPAELLGKRVVLHHLPVNWPQDLNLLEAEDPAATLREAALSQKKWVPVLGIGNEGLVDLDYTEDCEFGDAAVSLSNLNQLGQSVGEVLGGFDDLFGALEEEGLEQGVTGHVTAQWIEYEVYTPGLSPQIVRRPLFDLIGQAARIANQLEAPVHSEMQDLEWRLALLGETDILPLMSQLSPQFVSHLVTSNMLENQNFILGVFAAIDANDHAALEKSMETSQPLPNELYLFALARHQWDQMRNASYLDQINLVSYHKFLAQNMQGGLIAKEGIDIVINNVAAFTSENPFMVRLRQGVLDTNAEALVMRLVKPELPIANAAEAFHLLKDTVRWVTIQSTDDAAWQEVQLSPDQKIMIEQDLNAGYAVIIPVDETRDKDKHTLVWWRVDPATGDALGFVEPGFGASMVEFIELLTILGFVGGVAGFLAYVGCAGFSFSIRCLGCAVITASVAAGSFLAIMAGAPAVPVAVAGLVGSRFPCALLNIVEKRSSICYT